jgi:chromosome segregation ATPase
MNTKPPAIGRNPLQEAFDNYNQLSDELAQARFDNDELRSTNQSLVSEVTMLRAAYSEADSERIRLTQVAATLHGELKGIQAIINGAVASAVQAGVQAAQIHEQRQQIADEEPSLQHAADEVAPILERLAQVAQPEGQLTIERAPEQQPRTAVTGLPINQL